MKYIAFFATKTPEPRSHYAGIATEAGTMFIRTLDVSEHSDPLSAAQDAEREGETLLNTIEVESA